MPQTFVAFVWLFWITLQMALWEWFSRKEVPTRWEQRAGKGLQKSWRVLGLLSICHYCHYVAHSTIQKKILHSNIFARPVAAIVDTLLLLYYVVDMGLVGTFVRSEGQPEPLWYTVSFPYFLYPFKCIFISSSIFMVVAISAERHRAICSPLTHRPTFWPYAILVCCISCEYYTLHLK